MKKAVSLAHHNIYEYAAALRDATIESQEDTVIVDKNMLQQLVVAYMHLYTDVHINQKIRPLKALLPKEIIQ